MSRAADVGRVMATIVVVVAATGPAAGASGNTGPGEPPGTSEPAAPCEEADTGPSASTDAPGTAVGEPAEPVIDPGDGGDYAPVLDPADFAEAIDNPYLPFLAGSRWVYEGATDEGPEQTVVEVLDDRREIQGISAVVVRDTVSLDGVVIEDTYDWYAQDGDGNVWYLGEDSTTYECGEPVSTEGSWEYGIDGALPGIVMPAEPEVGFSYRQEYYEGEAEDLGRIEEVGVVRTIGLGEFDDVVVTTDWNPLDPAVVEQKSYARDVGLIYEEHVAGGDETAELVEFSPGG